jgi:hypothetical protein
MINRLVLTLFIAISFSALAQNPEWETIPPDYIRTVNFKGSSSEFSVTPIIRLGERLTLEFDDIIGDEEDYYYVIDYYNFDWTPTTISKNEYLEGFDNVRLVTYENSFNALQLYSHYTLQIPNEDTKRIEKSGNYMLKIYNDSKELMFSRKFIVYENLATVKAQVKRMRDQEFINTKQSVHFSISSDQLLIKNPDIALKTLVIQNNDLNTAISNLRPQYNIGNEYVYRYDTESSFWASNEFLNFDNKDVRAATINIKRIEKRDIYHNFLYTDGMRAFEPYTYYPDINGSYRVRTLQGRDEDIEAEYVWMHFSLQCYEDLNGGQLHIYGNFNNYILDDTTKLTYNKERGVYENERLFKQGFYNYKYILLNPDGSINPGFISGNFDKTENEYTVLAYYRDIGGRFDRVIGIGSANSVNITN